ncbi:2830_t:CDS:1, partial [Paraglomus occultum]
MSVSTVTINSQRFAFAKELATATMLCTQTTHKIKEIPKMGLRTIPRQKWLRRRPHIYQAHPQHGYRHRRGRRPQQGFAWAYPQLAGNQKRTFGQPRAILASIAFEPYQENPVYITGFLTGKPRTPAKIAG